MIAGTYLVVAGLSIETTVSGEGVYDRVANLQLMHIQELNVDLGIGLVIAAAVLLSTGALISFLAPSPNADD
ncbi:hypothetical protein SBA_ch1_23870 [Sphingomonas bisphenolicum]|uniref:Uncharacterized protein n=2 Tax=Sphingomonas bisphenolicum TaxID=296544 RepID=A0ABN5WLG3_9SPHN|nr:hypothetical protein SBA_ch1_23870 [Sphingomonas bisphenolicum]